MDIGAFVTTLPLWALFCLILAVSLLASETGSWFATLREKRGLNEPEAPMGTAVAAILGLLAFMLGFTFSFTESRFRDRKELVVKEANALATSYMRTSLLPEKQKLKIRGLYQEYADLLLKIDLDNSTETVVHRLEEIHLELWEQTASLQHEEMDSELRSLFTASVNDIAELFRERKTVAVLFRMPGILWSSLLLLVILSMFSLGYQTGRYGVRRIVETPMLAAAFAMVIILIADMDAVDLRRFTISQQPLQEVQKLMQKNIP